MRTLTYTDRSEILRIVEKGKQSSTLSREELVRQASAMLFSHVRNVGIEYALTRDVLALSYDLIFSENNDVQTTAQGALSYLINKKDFWPDDTCDYGLQDDHYVLGLAIHEISEITGNSLRYSGPELSEKQRMDVETKVAQYFEKPLLSDEKLLEHGLRVTGKIGHIAVSGFWGRFRRNMDLLFKTLSETSDDVEKKWSRAALSYLADENDLIPDDLGLIGFLDDVYAVTFALTHMKCNSANLISAIDYVVEKWPWLGWMVFTDNNVNHELSEFLITNMGLAQRILRIDQEPQMENLIVPVVNPIPVILGFLTAIGEVYESSKNGQPEIVFEKGQKVFFDGKAIRIFEGFTKTPNGIPLLGLREDFKQNGIPNSRIHWITDSEKNRARLQPANANRSTRGRIHTNLDTSTATIGALDRLLHTELPVQVSAVSKTIFVVTKTGSAQYLADNIKLYGQKLRDILPMGQCDPEGNIKFWSKKWNRVTPLIVFASDIPTICSKIQDDDVRKCGMVIVESSEKLGREPSSLQMLSNLGVDVLLLTPDAAFQANYEIAKQNFALTEWTEEELRDLIWESPSQESQLGILQQYDSILKRTLQSTVIPVCVKSEAAENAWNKVLDLREAAKQSKLQEDLEELAVTAWKILRRLMEWPIILKPVSDLDQWITDNITSLKNILFKNYLSPIELSCVNNAAQALESFRNELLLKNKKEEELRNLTVSNSPLSVVCRGKAAACQLRDYLLENQSEPSMISVKSCSVSIMDTQVNTIVITGWFNKRNMEKFLCPPAAKKVYLLLYESECVEYNEFKKIRRSLRSRHYATPVSISVIDGSNSHRSSRIEPKPDTVDIFKTEGRVDDMEELTQKMLRKQSINNVEPYDADDTISARLFSFADGYHAWLTDSYRAKRVTSLITGTYDSNEENEIELVSRNELEIGDYLLFNLGQDSDAIRFVADRSLNNPEIRNVSSLWRKALLRFRSNCGLSAEDIQEILKYNGCKHCLMTIRTWLDDDELIAPRSFTNDVSAIAKATGDEELKKRFNECCNAISKIYGAHRKASSWLAKRVMDIFSKNIRLNIEESSKMIDDTIVVVNIDNIDDEDTSIRRSAANRIIKDIFE
jgi:uncharacterized membrane protein YkvA (DUF1232 family)